MIVIDTFSDYIWTFVTEVQDNEQLWSEIWCMAW